MASVKKKWDVHSHCFTLKYVPEEFFSSLAGNVKFLRISQLNKFGSKQLVWLITRNPVIWIIHLFSKNFSEQLKRLQRLFYYKDYTEQTAMVDEEIRQYNKIDYFKNEQVNLALLSMDMKFMEAGPSAVDYLDQLTELKDVKARFGDRVKIFLHTDPRRIEEDLTFLTKHLPLFGQVYDGFKMYPTLGYYPFDKRLKPVYDFALQNNYPLLYHVSYGPVYRRKNIQVANHPITGREFYEGEKPELAQQNYAHPLNYQCLLDPQILSAFWGEPVDYSNLKIDMAHFGGPNDWDEYQKTLKKDQRVFKSSPNPLDIKNDWFGDNRFHWFEIIKAMINKYNNVYTDIAFTLVDRKFDKQVKTLLTDPKVGTRILFGTDYYVVAGEDEFADILHEKRFTEGELDLLSIENPARFFL